MFFFNIHHLQITHYHFIEKRLFSFLVNLIFSMVTFLDFVSGIGLEIIISPVS
jgi:hypothetical protein